jgi:hypothetical protein
LVATFFLLVGPAACADTATDLVINEPRYQYQNCPPAEAAPALCELFHPEAVAIEATAFCIYADCFEMSYGEATRVVAADELGAFPKMWFAWTKAEMVAQAGDPPCVLSQRGNKTRAEIPDGAIRCRADITFGDYVYHEHFASDHFTGCLAWLECKESM